MATTADRQHYALQTIFSFFLGLMVLAFIGVGVNTFYQPPTEKYAAQLQKLYDEQSLINNGKTTPLSPADQAKSDAIQKQINELQAKQSAEQTNWALYTSIILVVFATIVMGVSLVRSDQLRVLSNGLLLGGLFTMIYGSGWTIFSGSSYARFAVILFALVVAIGLGYVKFVRLRQGVGPVEPAAASGAPSDVSGLESRVAALEARTNAAAAALGTKDAD